MEHLKDASTFIQITKKCLHKNMFTKIRTLHNKQNLCLTPHSQNLKTLPNIKTFRVSHVEQGVLTSSNPIGMLEDFAADFFLCLVVFELLIHSLR